jgi:hypothetical protein
MVPKSADDKNQSKLFIEKACELGCDETSAPADELLGRLAKIELDPIGGTTGASI